MPTDLFVDPETAPAVYIGASLAILALISLAAVALFGAARRGGATPRTLLARWFTWLVIATVWGAACLSGPPAISLLMTVLALVGLREFVRLTGLPASHRALLAIGAIVAGGLALAGAAALLAMVPLLLLVGIIQPVVAADIRHGVRHLAFGALGFGYLPLLLGHGTLIARDVPEGGTVLFVLGVAVAFSDIGAYVAGRTFGRHPLAPLLSPNKTLEGLAGNLAGATVGLVLYMPVLPTMPALILIGLPPLVAVGAVWGDLFESALKREFGTKDAGTWLPGFGGLLDRIDSLILVLPLAYYGLRAAALVHP